MSVINIKNLCKHYKNIKALDNINLTIKKGTIFGLLGKNGAGKTTLISLLNGLIKPSSGEIKIFNQDLQNNLIQVRKNTSLIPQSLSFYENLSVNENLIFFSKVQKINGVSSKQNLAFAIEINDLGNILSQKASTLSGGQKRRLNIAIGLLNNPEVLFFDEPTVGIDPEVRNSILETISKFRDNGKTIIYSTHYMSEIEKICDDVAILHKGMLIECGSLAYFKEKFNNQYIEFHISNTDKKILELFSDKYNDIISITKEKILLEKQHHKLVIPIISELNDKKIMIKKIDYNNLTLEDIFLKITDRQF